MNRNRLIVLALITLVAIAAVVLIERGGSSDRNGDEGGRLLPGLADRVNDVRAVDIIGPDGAPAVRLRRDDSRWRVEERDDYEADFARVVDLLRTVSELERSEARTANPEWYARLGVQDPGAGNATGRGLAFPDSGLDMLIVGAPDPTGSGSYVRIEGQAQSWLADRIVELPSDPVEWLEPGIMDIGAEDLAEVEVIHPDGERVRLKNAGNDESDFVLLDVPEGRNAGPDWRRRSLANGLRGLNLDDVQRFRPPLPDDAVELRFRTLDGLLFEAVAFIDDDAPWLRFTVSESDPVELGESEPEAEPDNESRPPARASAEALDQRLSPWQFQIPDRRFEDLTRTLEDLLEPLEEN